MEIVSCQMVLGKDLTQEDLDTINYHRKIEFHSKSEIVITSDPDSAEKPYFLVRGEDDRLLSFGRLHSIVVSFLGESHPILGIAMIVSIEKHKGYGRVLMREISRYVNDSKLTAIGFCDLDDTIFYEKCGLGIIHNSMNRFVFSEEPELSEPADVIYIEGENNLIKDFLTHPNQKIIVPRPEW